MRVWHPSERIVNPRTNVIELNLSDRIPCDQSFNPGSDVWILEGSSFLWMNKVSQPMQTLVRDETGFTAWKDFS